MTTKKWSVSVGDRGSTVRVAEREPGGIIYLYWTVDRRPKKRSLGHRDKDRALDEAWAVHRQLRKGLDALEAGSATIGTILEAYTRHVTPTKCDREQTTDRSRRELVERVFGADRLPRMIRDRDWESFLRDRATGKINARGMTASEVEKVRKRMKRAGDNMRQAPRPPKPCSPRTLERTAGWVVSVFRWATTHRIDRGASEPRYLLDENPIRGYDVPSGEGALDYYPRTMIDQGDVDASPHQPIMTETRYRAMLDAVCRALQGSDTPTYTLVTSRALLPVVRWTGRRIGAVRRLRWKDVRLDDGAIDWPASTDKQRKRWRGIPLAPGALEALEWLHARRKVVAIDDRADASPVFPSVSDSAKPLPAEYARDLFLEVEDMAELEHVQGLGWHGFRRMRATEFKHSSLPVQDVATYLGMTLDTLQEIYQQDDEDTLRAVADYVPEVEVVGDE